MTLKEGRGKVPIWSDGPTPYILVDFPTREMFDVIYTNHQHTTDLKNRYWDILTARSKGETLESIAQRYSITRERVRQIEAKFIRTLSRLMKKGTFGKMN